jgi:hypothetical protein
MSLIKLNNRAVKDVTQFGSITSLGSLTHISTATASASASIEFSLGNYKEYQFYFIDIHPATDGAYLTFNMSVDSGSNYNVTKTTTAFVAYHSEGDASGLQYDANGDLAQSTNFQRLTTQSIGNDNDQCGAGTLTLFNPSSTTFVKHFISRNAATNPNDYFNDAYVAGYGNTTSAVDAIQFKMDTGNIDAGQILLFGVN